MALISPTTIAQLRIVLASASKQRINLLQQIGIEPIVIPSNYSEDLCKSLPPVEYVVETAKHKAIAVSKMLKTNEYDVIIGCDTVVLIDGEIIGKPKNNDEARKTLKRLNGRCHDVLTGVVLIDNARECDAFHEQTSVKFSEIPDAVIEEYVSSGESMGRAGSYGIQATGAIFVEHISGCYYNVVGLPINALMRRLWKRLYGTRANE